MIEQNVRTIHEQHKPVTGNDQVVMTKPSRRDPNSKSALDRRLDLALVETFPASDSIAVMIG